MSSAVETSEARWFKIAVFVVSGFFVGFSLANIIYFNRIRKNGGVPGITRGEATAMLWINAILFAIALIIFIWSIFRLVSGKEYRERVVSYFKEEGPGYIVPASTTGAPLPALRRQRVQETTTTTTKTTVQRQGALPRPSNPPPPPPAKKTVVQETIVQKQPVAIPRRALRQQITTTTN